jgi:XTP/dITP diphosphohydrolase
MTQLLLGTKNEGKIAEAVELLAEIEGLELLTFSDRPFFDVDETGETFLDNALLKARSIGLETGLPVLAEDAGLEVVHLGGAPGVLSARFSGTPVDYARNNELLLRRMKAVADRRARFVTVAVLQLPDGQTFASSGVLRGAITETPRGTGGFGYDPLFVPEGSTRTLAEMSLGEKNRISHRKRALSRMRPILVDLLDSGELQRPADPRDSA